MVILSVDYGDVRTGIAVCDKMEMLASPVTVIEEWNRDKLCEKICTIAKERKAQQLVLGLPKNMDGSEGESALGAREFGAKLAEASGLPLDFQDERGTTVTAHSFLNETNTRGKKRKAVVDTVSAVIILQDFIDSRKK